MNSDESLVDLFRQAVAGPRKNCIVLRDGDRTWTLEELDNITDILAKYFIQNYNCKKGSCVAIYMNKCAEYVFAYIAALKAGKTEFDKFPIHRVGRYIPIHFQAPLIYRWM